MMEPHAVPPVDYVVVGHLSWDKHPHGVARLGGTAAYAALTARRLGLRVGVVTAYRHAHDWAPLDVDGVFVTGVESPTLTTFVLDETPAGRTLRVEQVGPRLHLHHVPQPWRTAAIAHLAPIAQEVEPTVVQAFPRGLIGLTPQGWLREWDEHGVVRPGPWPEAEYLLPRAGAVVLSEEDLGHDEAQVARLARQTPVLVVTRGAAGADLYWQGRVYHHDAPQVEVVDPTGAGDIFAAVFFVRLYWTRDPLDALARATELAARSVTRPGLAGVPTEDEVAAVLAVPRRA